MPRLLRHQNETGVWRTFAENRLRGAFVEVTPAAIPNSIAQYR